MIYEVPDLGKRELQAVARIDELRSDLRWSVGSTRRWLGGLRRLTFAKAVQGSNTIEGYHATIDDVLEVVDHEAPLDAVQETTLALEGYRDAMTYVLQLAEDATPPVVDTTLIKALHFMMMKYDLRQWPGRWRPGPIFVEREADHTVVYEGPDASLIDELVGELASAVAVKDGPALVRAAMAHLNLVMIHPFKDGNGRMSRCLQTLVLAQDQILAPVFCSIEEYLGQHTQTYYDVLAKVGRGSWNPGNDARPWVRFCINAHFQQAQTLRWRIAATMAVWERCDELAKAEGLPARVVGPLALAAQGHRLRNATYRNEVREAEGLEIGDQTANGDLRRLVKADLLAATGETRGRHYFGSARLRSLWADVRAASPEPSQLDLFR